MGTMDEALKNHVTNYVEYNYLNELKNKHTGLLRFMYRNLLNHLHNPYGKTTSADLKTNNQRIN